MNFGCKRGSVRGGSFLRRNIPRRFLDEPKTPPFAPGDYTMVSIRGETTVPKGLPRSRKGSPSGAGLDPVHVARATWIVEDVGWCAWTHHAEVTQHRRSKDVEGNGRRAMRFVRQTEGVLVSDAMEPSGNLLTWLSHAMQLMR